MEFTFQYRDTYPDQDLFPTETFASKSVRFDGATWDKVLAEFIMFLSSVYGYDIKDKVSYKTVLDKIDELYEAYPNMFENESTEGREFN